MTPGQIHKTKTLFFRMNVGSAEDPETGNVYELSAHVADHSPIIQSKKTGKWWTISWQELIALAEKAGIQNEDPAHPTEVFGIPVKEDPS